MAWAEWSQKLAGVRWGYWFGVTFFSAVICWLVLIGLELRQQAVEENTLPVRSISLLGDRNYTRDEEIYRVLPKQQLQSFIALDVNEVQQRIEALPWVYSASVRKQWPDTLQIYLQEQQPVAHWNGDLMLNAKGEAFQLDAAKVSHTLPYLYGPEGSEEDALQGYDDLTLLLALTELKISEMTLSERFSWQLTLNNEVRLVLGREDKIKRMQRFIDFYPQLLQQQKAVEYVDLRYDTGFAVKWHEKGQ